MHPHLRRDKQLLARCTGTINSSRSLEVAILLRAVNSSARASQWPSNHRRQRQACSPSNPVAVEIQPQALDTRAVVAAIYRTSVNLPSRITTRLTKGRIVAAATLLPQLATRQRHASAQLWSLLRCLQAAEVELQTSKVTQASVETNSSRST